MKQLIAIFALLVGMILFVAWLQAGNLTLVQTKEFTMKVGDATITVELADTPEKQQKGLAGRDSISEERGMLFAMPENSEPIFLMRGMKFPIDIVWIDDSKVVGFEENIQPPKNEKEENLPLYRAPAPVDYVLEVQAGFVKKHNIARDTPVQLPQF